MMVLHRHALLSAALRIRVRQWRRSGKMDREQADAALSALRDEDACCVICCAVEAQMQADLAAGNVIDEILKLLQWLLDHADEIIALILKLLPLFTELD